MANNIPLTSLQKAQRQLAAKWINRTTIMRVGLQSGANGKPMFVLEGPSEHPPGAIPGSIFIPDMAGNPVRVPIFWRAVTPSGVRPLMPPPVRQLQAGNGSAPVAPSAPIELFNQKHGASRPLDPLNNDDIDRAYFWFFSHERRETVDIVRPAFNVPEVPVLGQIPPADHIDSQMSFDSRVPQYDSPNFWSKSFEPYGCLCCTYYDTPSILFTYLVPQDYMVVVDGISFDIDAAVLPGETFSIDVLRNNEQLFSFEEVVIDPANPDNAHRFLFTGHGQPIPLWARFDRNEQITVRATFRGPFPFVKGPLDPFCGTLCVLLHGWRASIMDNRDGAARPSDIGGMRDFAGDEVLQDSWVMHDMRDRLGVIKRWITEATAYVK